MTALHYSPLLPVAVQQSSGAFSLDIGTGFFVLSGQGINDASIVITIDTGSFVLSGQPINAAPSLLIPLEVGRFNADGRSINQPLAAGSGIKIVTLGDSIMEYANGNTSPTRIDHQSDGEIHWVKARGKAGFQHDLYYAADAYWYTPSSRPLSNGANQGRAGDWATGVKRRLTAVINMTPQIVVLNIGTNLGTTEDGNSTAAVTIAEIDSIVATLTGAGIKLVLGTVRPRAVTATGSSGTYSYEITPVFRGRIDDINAHIRGLDNNSTIFVWDADLDLLDPAPIAPLLTGSMYPWAVRDGVHLAPRGAAASARSLELTIDRILGDGTWFDSDASVTNAVPNGVMTGTGGTVGTGVTGQAPTSHAVSNASGSGLITTVSSVVANGWKLAISGIGGSSSTTNVQLIRATSASIDVAAQGWTSTTWVKLFAEIEVSNGELLGGLHLDLIQGGSTIRSQGLGVVVSDRATQPHPNLARSGWIETVSQQVGSATALSSRIDIEPRIDVAGDVSVIVKKIIMREVADPHVTFPYDPMDPAQYVLSGQPVSISTTGNRVLDIETGSFALSGQAVTITVSGSTVITLDPASFSLSGQAVTITVSGINVSLDFGSFILTGQPATLTTSAPPIVVIPVNIQTLLRSRQRGYRRTKSFMRSNIGFHPAIVEIPDELPDGLYLTDGTGAYLLDGTGAYLTAT